MPKHRLTAMDLDEISVVFSGDDPRAEVVIAKSATSPGGSSTVTANDAWEDPNMPEDVTINKDDLPQEVVDYIDALETAVDALLEDPAPTAPVTKGTPAPAAEADDLDAWLAKADPQMIELINKAYDQAEAADKRAEEAEKVAKAERDTRLRTEAIAKAESLPMISDSKDDLAEILLALGDTPDLAEKVEKLFVAANEQIAKGNLFTEMGKTSSDFSIGSDVSAVAAEIQKANPDLTPEQALVRAMESNSSLYDELQEG